MMKIIILLFLLTQTVFAQTNVFDIARSGTVEQVRELFKTNPESINSKNENGHTPLILATYRGNVAVAKFLIENSKTINVAADMGTPLMAATVKGDVDLAILLLENDANPNLTDDNGTVALMYAIQFQNIDLVKLLLANKADKTLKNKEGKSAFDYAIKSGNQVIIDLIKTMTHE